MPILTYIQVLIIQFAIQCCFGKYLVQSDVTTQTTSSQWNDLISSSSVLLCTNDKSEKYVGQATSSNQIQWQRSFNIQPLTNKVYIYFEYQISGQWNDDEVVLYVDNVKQCSEKIQLADTNKLCNEKQNFLQIKLPFQFLYVLGIQYPSKYFGFVNQGVQKQCWGLYKKCDYQLINSKRKRRNIINNAIIQICNVGQSLAHYYCKCNDALVYQDTQCIASCDQNYLYSLNDNQCYQKQHCTSCVGLNSNLQCDSGYYAYVASDQDLPVCISKCPNNYYQDETTQACLDYQEYLSTNQNSGYPVDYIYFIRTLPEFIHFLSLNDLQILVVSEPKRPKERQFFYLDNNFYIGSYNNFKNQSIQIYTIIKNPQHKVKLRATCHFVDFYPTNFEVHINEDKQDDIE